MNFLLSVTLKFGQINVFEYKKRLLSLLQDVKKGKPIIIPNFTLVQHC